MNVWPTHEEIVSRMKDEIIALMDNCTIPQSVRAFDELHDYIDANMLASGIMPEYPELEDDDEQDEAAEEWMDESISLLNPAQNEISAWLKSRHFA